VEIIFEILVQIFLWIVQLLFEFLLQILGEALIEFGIRGLREPFRRPEPLNPWLAAMGYAILGSVVGGLSLLLFPELFIKPRWLRVVNLLVTPLLAGGLMSALGAWRSKKGQELIRLDRFSYGFLFAFAMALVRFVWGR
jgi:hypothetical protein